MKPEVKKAWVKALRSGKYRKGKEYLKREIAKDQLRYCCLGVLCETQGARMRVRKRPWDEAKTYEVGGDAGYLPESYQRRYGVSSTVMNALVELNDKKSWSFNRIATWIEKNL